MKPHMNKDTRNWLILIILIVVALLATLWATSTSWLPPRTFEPREFHPPPPEDIEFFYTVQTVVSTVNVTLSFILLLIYVSIFRRTRSEFTIGLIVFLVAFFLNAIFSNPLVTQAFGYSPIGLGPFVLLPDVFTFTALAVLLYLSVKY